MKARSHRPRRLPREVTIRVPGSTSNCGAGFDSLGMALAIYNDITLTRGDWRGAQPAAASDSHGLDMADEAAQLFFVRAGVEEIGYTLAIRGDVPMSADAQRSTSAQVSEPSPEDRYSKVSDDETY